LRISSRPRIPLPSLSCRLPGHCAWEALGAPALTLEQVPILYPVLTEDQRKI
jgi:hypothetical protein